jgi:general nucleoside transport system permease protein
MSSIQNVQNETRRKPFYRSRWVSLLFGLFALLFVYLLVNKVIEGQCESACVISALKDMFYYATPITFAALTGLICERSGIVNIGIEGQLLMSAMVGYAVNFLTYQVLKDAIDPVTAGNISRWVAVLVGILASVLMGLLLAVISIKYKTDQIIGGTVIYILALGITGYIYFRYLAQNQLPGPGTFPVFPIPGLSQIPIIGKIMFNQQPLTYIMLLAVFFIYYALFYTPWGLRVRAVGEHPRAADTLGINVNKTRYIAVALGSILAGLGGVWFTLQSSDVFNPGMTNGLGFIGLAAMIFGKWNPIGALLGACIFGLGSSITTTVSIFRPDIPSRIPQMLPYVLTIIVLTGVIGRAIPPAAENKPYDKQ